MFRKAGLWLRSVKQKALITMRKSTSWIKDSKPRLEC
jgi:hypothetical protein